MKYKKPKPFKSKTGFMHGNRYDHKVDWYINTSTDIMTVQEAKEYIIWLTKSIKWLEQRYKNCDNS